MVDAEHGEQVLLVTEVAERAVAEVVQQAGHAQGLLHQRERRRAGLDLGQRRGTPGAPARRPRCMVPRLCGEPAVLGRGEHPPGALQLVDALEPLDPRVVDDVRLGDLAGPRQCDAQVAVQRVGDEGGHPRRGASSTTNTTSRPDGDKDGDEKVAGRRVWRRHRLVHPSRDGCREGLGTAAYEGGLRRLARITSLEVAQNVKTQADRPASASRRPHPAVQRPPRLPIQGHMGDGRQ